MNRRGFFSFLAGAAATPLAPAGELAMGHLATEELLAISPTPVPGYVPSQVLEFKVDATDFVRVSERLKQDLLSLTSRVEHEPDDWRGFNS